MTRTLEAEATETVLHDGIDCAICARNLKEGRITIHYAEEKQMHRTLEADATNFEIACECAICGDAIFPSDFESREKPVAHGKGFAHLSCATVCRFCSAPIKEEDLTGPVTVLDEYDDIYCDESCLEGHRENQNERAYERQLEDFYGGSGPVTLDEQHREAWKLK